MEVPEILPEANGPENERLRPAGREPNVIATAHPASEAANIKSRAIAPVFGVAMFTTFASWVERCSIALLGPESFGPILHSRFTVVS